MATSRRRQLFLSLLALSPVLLAVALLQVIPVAAAGPITLSLQPSRVSGVAPLSVFFDATGTTSTTVTKPFHHLDYAWDFGDPQSGAWGTDGKSRNQDKGPVAVHLFEQPGTYTVTLTVTDPQGNTATQPVTITVTDPNVVFAGTNTVCFSTGTDFTGCPNGAQQVTTSSFSTIIDTYLAPNKRLLLKRGDTFTSAKQNYFDDNGPGILGAFGNCQSPDAFGICANNPLITTTNGAPVYFTSKGIGDWRFLDLHFLGDKLQTGYYPAFWDSHQIREMLFNRLHVEEFTNAFSLSSDIGMYWRHSGGDPTYPFHDQLIFANSRFEDAPDGIIVYVGSQRLALLGNAIDNSYATSPNNPGSATLRITLAEKGVVSHNAFHRVGNKRACIKLHAPCQQITWNSCIWKGEETYEVFASDNIFSSAQSDWCFDIVPQNPTSDEHIRDVVVERNTFIGDSEMSQFVNVQAQDVTVRNNIFNADQCEPNSICPAVTVFRRSPGAPIPSGVEVYNNVFYSSSTNPHVFLRPVDHVGNILIKNNLFSTPNSPNTQFIGTGTAPTLSQNNFGETNPKQDPLFVDPSQGNFRLQPTSPAIDYGIAVPVLDDYDHQPRPQGTAYDAGAFEYSSGTGTAFAFSLATNPASLSVEQGQGATSVVTVTHLSGNPQPVTFSAANPPSGVTAQFAPASCTPPQGQSCTSILTLQTTPTTPPVTNHQLTLTASSPSTQRTAFLTLSVTPSCGNGVCSSSESCSSCPQDCGTCPTCQAGQTQPCPLQSGVCQGSQDACASGQWPGCSPQTYLAHHPAYEQTETLCDALDNDCDGQADEGCPSADDDGDGVPNAADQCPNTPPQTTVNPFSGCPVPRTGFLTPGLTTDFLDNVNLSSLENLSLGVQDAGLINFSENVSVLRYDPTLQTHLGLDLSSLDISPNRIVLDPAQLPELNKPATLTLFKLSLNRPEVLRDGQPCASCQVISYMDSNLTFTVPGFSTYSARETPFCGDGSCTEDCSSCPQDCGSCPGSNGGNGGGSPFICSTGSAKACGSSVGECRQGQQSCSNNQWGSCQGAVNSTSELCDGKDNDCDGKVDDLTCLCLLGQSKPCGSNIGSCREGVRTCDASGNWGSCTGDVQPAAEVCGNGSDEDCDGQADEGCGAANQTPPDVCANGRLDEGEEGVDCGGGCRACAEEPEPGFPYPLVLIGVGVAGMVAIGVLGFRQKDSSRDRARPVAVALRAVSSGGWALPNVIKPPAGVEPTTFRSS